MQTDAIIEELEEQRTLLGTRCAQLAVQVHDEKLRADGLEMELTLMRERLAKYEAPTTPTE